MQKLIAILLFLTVSTASFSQTTTTTPMTKEDYLQKSKNQKKAAQILLVGGLGFIGISFLIPKGELKEWGIIWSSYENDGIKGFFALTGFLSSVVSIPVFGVAHRNKKKAMRLSFKNETVQQLQINTLRTCPLPSLSFKINI